MLRKHRDNDDVAIQILKIFYVREKKLFKLKVRWWNIGRTHVPHAMNIDEKIEIPLAEFSAWEPYEFEYRGQPEMTTFTCRRPA